ncbi:hypothetical protein FACS1894216_12020 [Synergistales bacterium]|nr:hypothetical protein FACS1894216_12020 [Synergistales bacterium]
MLSYTACYTKTESGYTGQLLEWPEVITEGETIEDCREMLEDAAREMIEVYKEDKMSIPQGHVFFECLSIFLGVVYRKQGATAPGRPLTISPPNCLPSP